MEKLTYTKINNSDNVIAIDLHNGFTVIAISGCNNDKLIYTTTLYIKDNTIEILNLIEEASSIKFHATNYKTVNSLILKIIDKYLADGFFETYIDRYKFDMCCLDMGYNILEKDRLLKEGKNNDNKK